MIIKHRMNYILCINFAVEGIAPSNTYHEPVIQREDANSCRSGLSPRFFAASASILR